MSTFVIGDLHFGHRKVAMAVRGFPTVEQHNHELIARWNSRVRSVDTVYVLGDVVFGASYLPLLDKLNGLKKLVMGNHDNEFASARWLDYFARIMGCAEVNGWLLSHMPVHPNQLGRWPLNVHGHMHTNTVGEPGYFCASAERIGLAPITLEEIAAQSDAAISRETQG